MGLIGRSYESIVGDVLKGFFLFMPQRCHNQLQRCDEGFHLFNTLFLHIHCNMHVFIHCKGDSCMAKIVRDCFYIHSIL